MPDREGQEDRRELQANNRAGKQAVTIVFVAAGLPLWLDSPKNHFLARLEVFRRNQRFQALVAGDSQTHAMSVYFQGPDENTPIPKGRQERQKNRMQIRTELAVKKFIYLCIQISDIRTDLC